MTIDYCYFLIKNNFVRFLGYKHGFVWGSDYFHYEMEVPNYFNVLYQLVYAYAINALKIKPCSYHGVHSNASNSMI